MTNDENPGIPRLLTEEPDESDYSENAPGAGKFIVAARLVFGLAWLVFQIYLLYSPQLPLIQNPVHLCFALALLFLWRPVSPRRPVPRWAIIVDTLLLLGVTVAMAYYFFSAERLTGRMEGVDDIPLGDVLIGYFLILAVLEGVRRIIGWSLLSLLIVFIVLGFVGTWFPGWVHLPWVPELFKFSGFSLEEAVEGLALTSNGILGVTTSTSVMFVFYFVVFGAVYSAIGGGQLFIDIGLRVAGRQVGGPAKAAVISSSLMGSITGSAVANVVSTGIFTIPLMRRTGYTRTQSAALEAIASTGGQLAPPVMGIAAFVMAELLQIPYTRIALAGLIPALAFYFSIYLLVDLNARKRRLGTARGATAPSAPIPRRLYLLIPPLLLIGMLLADKSAGFAAAAATASCVPVSFLRRASWRGWREWLEAIVRATRQAAEVAVPIASIGIVIEIAVQSNLALKFSIWLIELGANNALVSLALIIVGCIIMGTGLPTVAAYMIGAIFFVPVMRDLGIEALPAHFFVMYYSVLSMVTPPVALAAFTAAGLAQANRLAASWQAFRLSWVAFFIPFLFVFQPALLGQGSLWEIVLSVIGLSVAIMAWAVAMEGYCFRLLTPWQARFTGVASIALFAAPLVADQLKVFWGVDIVMARTLAWTVAVALLAAAIAFTVLVRPKPAANGANHR